MKTMRNGTDSRVTVSVRLTQADIAALDAESRRRTRADGERFDRSRLIREQLRYAPWYAPRED